LEYLENEPESFEAMTYLGECYEKINDYSMSRKYYQDAIDLAPEYADPWFGLGVVALNSGNVTDSLIFFRKAVRLDDENPEYWYLLGKAHYIKGELKYALSCFREALKIDTYYDEAWSDLGRIIIKENICDKAIPYLEHAYQVTGNIAGINYLLAACYFQISNPEKAFRYLSLALDSGRDCYCDYSDLFSSETKRINKLLKSHGLI
jgi:tetratricopeptide (TPR) repeat protein